MITGKDSVAFMTSKSENPAAQNCFICFSIDYLIANIGLYALTWPKLNLGCYLTFEIIFVFSKTRLGTLHPAASEV